jgi:uncharacterized protein YndB with AHSA1/START domain
MSDLQLKVSKTIHAPIDKVFDSWLDAETLSRFMLPMPGMENPEVETNPVVGGEFTITMRVGDNSVPHTGNYIEIDRPRKLVFSWNSPASPDDSVVTLNLTKIDEQQTNVELTQIRFIDEQHRSNHEGGWGNILLSLSEQVS